MISKDKQYTTRDGREVRIYATDAGGDYPVHGAVFYKEDGFTPQSWTSDGVEAIDFEDDLDLIEKPEVIEGWINVYDDLRNFRHDNKRIADMAAGSDRIACIHIKFTIGEGLNND